MVYSDSLKAHVDHLKCIFTTLREHNLLCEKGEVRVLQDEIQLFGYVIKQGLMKMDAKKVEAIIDWHVLKKVAELRSFLGLAN